METSKLLRARLHDPPESRLPRWIKKEATGIPSVKAMSLNHTALELLATWHCPRVPYTKMINVDVLRKEASGW